MQTCTELPFSSSASRCLQTEWTAHENKLFENALAEFDDDGATDRWEKVATRVPGKTVEEVVRHYEMLVEDVELIESGRAPLPHYLDDDDDEHDDEPDDKLKRKGNRTADHERRKGVAWNEGEHRLFLMGLTQYGKGDWRSISRNCVVTRTPTQVASHAQKYFNRLNKPGKKEKRRASIHDIRTINEKDSNPTNALQSSPTACVAGPMPAVGAGDSLLQPSAGSHNPYGGLGRSSGFAGLPMGNLRVGGFGNFTSVNFRDGPAYSLYNLPAVQRRSQ